MGISFGIRSPNPRAKVFKSFDLVYQSLTSNLTEDRDARYELTVANEVIGRHLQVGFGTGLVVPELEDLGAIHSWLEWIRSSSALNFRRRRFEAETFPWQLGSGEVTPRETPERWRGGSLVDCDSIREMTREL